MSIHRIVAGAVLALVAVPASATSFIFDFSKTHTLTGGSHDGNARTYSLSNAGLTVKLRASAWSWDGTTIRDSTLGLYGSNGLGVTSGDDDGGAGNQHTVDNEGRVDFILLQFDRVVALQSAQFAPFTINGGRTVDSDASIGRSIINNPWNSTPVGLDGRPTNSMTNLFQAIRQSNNVKTVSATNPNAVTEVRSLNMTGVTGRLWMISASLVNSDRRFDAFKLNQLKVESSPNMVVTGPVPEPAQWSMLISGFGILGAAVRRRRALAVA